MDRPGDGSRKDQALALSAQLFSKAFHANPNPMAIARLRDGLYLDINDASLKMLGYERDEVVGHTGVQLNFVDPEVREKVRQATLHSQPVRNLETRIRTRSGALRDVLLSLEPVEIDGELCVLGTTIDVTEQKLAEQQLQHVQKLEALGRLAGGMAHDFNNLLTVINGNATLALFDLQRGHPAYPRVEEILRAGERAAGLTRRLLIYCRKGGGAAGACDLNRLIHDLTPMLQSLLGEAVRLVTVLAPDVRVVHIDRGQLEQVILNLAVNAWDAMDAAGTLTLETAAVDLPAPPRRCVRLTISDTGAGMTPEVQARIFEPFFSTKEEGKGTGLGLSLARGIVERVGGQISVSSQPGRGSRFEIFLPVVSPPPPPPDAGEDHRRAARAAHRGDETILVVEDDEDVRSFLGEALASQGYRVLSAGDGRQALALLETATPPPAALITDVVMRGMGGRELAERLRRARPDLPILFICGYLTQPTRDQLPDDAPLLRKPFSPFDLTRELRRLLDRRG